MGSVGRCVVVVLAVTALLLWALSLSSFYVASSIELPRFGGSASLVVLSYGQLTYAGFDDVPAALMPKLVPPWEKVLRNGFTEPRAYVWNEQRRAGVWVFRLTLIRGPAWTPLPFLLFLPTVAFLLAKPRTRLIKPLIAVTTWSSLGLVWLQVASRNQPEGYPSRLYYMHVSGSRSGVLASARLGTIDLFHFRSTDASRVIPTTSTDFAGFEFIKTISRTDVEDVLPADDGRTAILYPAYDMTDAALTLARGVRFPLWPLTVTVGIVSVVALVRGPLLQKRRLREGRCIRCGYMLRGCVGPQCPECGRRFTEQHLVKPIDNESVTLTPTPDDANV